jgi:hypothetical protein
MAYVRTKRVPGPAGKTYTYYQLVEGYRDKGKVRQRVLCHLGRHPTPEEALTHWDRRANYERQHGRDELRAAQVIRDDAIRPLRYNHQTRKWLWLLPREGTELPEDGRPPATGAFAPRGWRYHRGGAEEAEREAAEHFGQAERWEKRAAGLRALL